MTSRDPIVLIGAARSGTKFLRDVLAASDDVAKVPYDVNYIWRYGHSGLPHDHLHPEDLTEKQVVFIRRQLKRLSSQKENQALLEKTVSNCLRVPYVNAVLPNARYIHLIRDGRDVSESAMRLWQAKPDWSALIEKLKGMPLANLSYVFWFAKNFLMGKKNGREGGKVWGPRFKGVDDLIARASLAEICAQQWVVSVETAKTELAAIDQNQVFEIRYEDLVSNESALVELLEWLGVADKDQVLEFYSKKLRPVPEQQWRALPQDSQDTFERVLSPTLKKLGYKAK